MARVLITGSAGLVGVGLRAALEARGHDVRGLDLRANSEERGDVRDAARVAAAIEDVDGVVHLAAVSRVVWGERDPELCWSTNVGGLENVLAASEARVEPPWLIFASSREVYGQPGALPVDEDAPIAPLNVYGRSKVAGEERVARASIRACTVRLSNVYGAVIDHPDRVVPAFARAALDGATLRVDGRDHVFDFTHLDDTTRGLALLVDRLASGAPAPAPIHFVTGRPTTLGELAALAISLAGTDARLEESPARDYDVARFYGSPARAEAVLGWAPTVALRDGLARLMDALRKTPPPR